MAPIERNGSLILYNCIIRPNFLRYHHKVDALISSAQDAGIFFMTRYIYTYIVNTLILITIY